MTTGPLTFIPVDLNSHENLCVRFSEDAFIESFSDASRFHELDGRGADRYRAWLKDRLAADPTSAVMGIKDSKIIGQVTVGHWKQDPSIGYLKVLGFKHARLSVSPTNKRALRFYETHGWRDLGPRAGHPEVHFMEKTL